MKVIITDCDHDSIDIEKKVFADAGMEVELKQAITETASFTDLPEILVEEYNDGYEFNMMTWVHKGKVHVISIADREKTDIGPGEIPISTRNVYPSCLYEQVVTPATDMEPKGNVVALVAGHFADRMPSEDWMIIDDGRGLGVIHPKNEPFYVTEFRAEEMERLRQTEQQEDLYTKMWKEFFYTIAVEKRENPGCQRNMFPLRYRKHVTEFL